MKTHANQVHKQRVRFTAIAMAMSSAAAIAVLVGWTPSSIGSANHDSAPAARLPAVPAQAAGTKAVPAVPGHGPGALPTGPMCAERGVFKTARFTEGSGESAEALGCGIGNNLAGGTHMAQTVIPLAGTGYRPIGIWRDAGAVRVKSTLVS